MRVSRRTKLRAAVALAALGLGCGGVWAYATAPNLPGPLPTAAERAARADVQERLDAWSEILRRAADGAVPDADLVAAGVDPASPSVRWMLADAHEAFWAYEPGTFDVRWDLGGVHLDADGSVRASAYRHDGHEYTPENAEHDNQGEDEARQRRLFAFEPGAGGLVLVSDVPYSWPEWAPWRDGKEEPDAT